VLALEHGLFGMVFLKEDVVALLGYVALCLFVGIGGLRLGGRKRWSHWLLWLFNLLVEGIRPLVFELVFVDVIFNDHLYILVIFKVSNDLIKELFSNLISSCLQIFLLFWIATSETASWIAL
jgi:hypothetical protein